jgi:hypothetical protein
VCHHACLLDFFDNHSLGSNLKFAWRNFLGRKPKQRFVHWRMAVLTNFLSPYQSMSIPTENTACSKQAIPVIDLLSKLTPGKSKK